MANPVTTAQSGPWGPQADYLKYGLAASLNQLQQGLAPFYPDATVVGPTKGMQAGWDMQGNYITGDDAAAQQAAAQSALSGIFGTGGAAQQYGRSLMGPQTQAQFGAMTPFSGQQYGDLLAGKANLAGINPVVSAMGHDVMESFVPQLKRAQDMGVAYQKGGGSRQAGETRRIMGDVGETIQRGAAPFYQQAAARADAMRLPAAQMGVGQQQFGQNLGLQGGQLGLGGVGQYRSVLETPLKMAQNLYGVGVQQRGLQQEALNQDINRYNYTMNRDRQALNDYLSQISGGLGGTSRTTTPGPTGLDTAGKALELMNIIRNMG